jgi:hypothetical protein
MESTAKKPNQKRQDPTIGRVAALIILVGILSVGGTVSLNYYMGQGLLGKSTAFSKK